MMMLVYERNLGVRKNFFICEILLMDDVLGVFIMMMMELMM